MRSKPLSLQFTIQSALFRHSTEVAAITIQTSGNNSLNSSLKCYARVLFQFHNLIHEKKFGK